MKSESLLGAAGPHQPAVKVFAGLRSNEEVSEHG